MARINRNTLASFLRSRSRLVWNSKPHPLRAGHTYNVGRNAAKREHRAIFAAIMARLFK
jgi:hypothetical protein